MFKKTICSWLQGIAIKSLWPFYGLLNYTTNPTLLWSVGRGAGVGGEGEKMDVWWWLASTLMNLYFLFFFFFFSLINFWLCKEEQYCVYGDRRGHLSRAGLMQWRNKQKEVEKEPGGSGTISYIRCHRESSNPISLRCNEDLRVTKITLNTQRERERERGLYWEWFHLQRSYLLVTTTNMHSRSDPNTPSCFQFLSNWEFSLCHWPNPTMKMQWKHPSTERGKAFIHWKLIFTNGFF